MALVPAALAFPATAHASEQSITAHVDCSGPINVELHIGPIDIHIRGTLDCDDHDQAD